MANNKLNEVLSDRVKVSFNKNTGDRVGKEPRLEEFCEHTCVFCNKNYNPINLFTRKQIYVCKHCTQIVDELRQTNHTIISEKKQNEGEKQ